jgi:hypothetical protein
MLTVWRKLTLEVDSMDRESDAFNDRYPASFEQDRCAVAIVTPDSPGPGFTTVQCGVDPEDPWRVPFAGTNFFEGGAFWCVDGGPEWLIVRSAAGPDSYTLTLWGNPGTGIVGQQCRLRDDDPYFGATGGAGQFPVTTVLDENIRRVYRDGYIEIIEANPSLNLVNLVPWQAHLPWLEFTILHYDRLMGVSSQWDLGSQDAFWVRHVVMCYQSDRNQAGDGDKEENCAISQNCQTVSAPYSSYGLPALPARPLTFGYTLRNEVLFDTALSTIYVETIRDQQVDVTSPQRWQFVAHELGHIVIKLGGVESGGEHVEQGLMSGDEYHPLQNIPAHQRFTTDTLRRLREVQRW